MPGLVRASERATSEESFVGDGRTDCQSAATALPDAGYAGNRHSKPAAVCGQHVLSSISGFIWYRSISSAWHWCRPLISLAISVYEIYISVKLALEIHLNDMGDLKRSLPEAPTYCYTNEAKWMRQHPFSCSYNPCYAESEACLPVSYLSSSFSSSSTATFSWVSSPFTMVSGELATLMSGSSWLFSR